MTRELETVPSARHWRNIPQQVKPRAMSREGRWRLGLGFLRWAGAGVALAVAGWGAWQGAAVWRGSPGALVADAAAVPLKSVTLTTDGVLDHAWLERALALPKNATLPQLDLPQLRARVLASGQAKEATLIRDYPATLAVHLAERSPVARIKAAGADQPLLVDRYGAVYEGVGYNPALINSLPWLDGIRLTRQDRGFAPIPGMDQVADLLRHAQSDAPSLYRTWRVVSLAQLQADGDIVVRTKDQLEVIFGTQEQFFPQLARLDLLLDTPSLPGTPAIVKIDLSLPSQDSSRPAGIPVTYAAEAAAAPAAPPAPAFTHFTPIKIEL